MEVIITQFTSSEIFYHLVTAVGGLLIIFAAIIAISKYGPDPFFMCCWMLLFALFSIYRYDNINDKKVREYSNALKQEILKSQDIIVIDKKILIGKSHINDLEILLLRENYKAVRENRYFIYFQKHSDKSQ